MVERLEVSTLPEEKTELDGVIEGGLIEGLAKKLKVALAGLLKRMLL